MQKKQNTTGLIWFRNNLRIADNVSLQKAINQNKKVIAVISTDWHIKPSNKDSILDLVDQKIKLSKRVQCDNLICLGDVFHSREAQRLDVLSTFEECLDKINENEMTLNVIAGNHDKTDYESEKSFLSSFKHHPGIVLYNSLITGKCFKTNIVLYFLQFYSENLWIEKFNKIETDKKFKNVLFTHVAFEGSINNDGSKVTSPIKPSLFNHFDLVISGHYHNHQKVTDNIIHCPSIQQNNYGEDQFKGFMLLYEDLNWEIVPSSFKRYEKIQINLETISKQEINDITEQFSNSKDNVRFEFLGSESKVKALKKQRFVDVGIEVKTKYKEVEDNLEYNEEVTEYNKESLKEEFKIFCKKENKDYKQGKKYLV
jgi:DNA repair exonuclease SbcCD nuclease subunit